jgi:hypothetical protein
MKTKNQTGQSLLELAETKAANEDGFTAPADRDTSATARTRAWSPMEVWRTRVKADLARSESTPI